MSSYNEIIKTIDKYSYVYMNGKKPVIVGRGSTIKEAKDAMLTKLNSKLEKLENSLFYRVKIGKVSKEQLEKDKKKKIPLIGGPVVATITIFKLVNSKLKNTGDETNVYYSNKYLKTINKIAKRDIQNMVYAEHYNLTIGFGKINTIESINKKVNKN